MAELYHASPEDVEILTRAKGGDGRTVFGRAVPFNVDQYINPGLVERFAPGAFRHQLSAANRVRFTRDHMSHGGTLIGKTLSLEERSDGLYGTWRVSATAAGDETLELLRDGVLTHLSIGFRTTPNGSRKEANGVTTRTKAHLFEVSVVMDGAYGDGATVSEVREADPTPNLAAARSVLSSLPPLPLW